jgi:hypothetical protein
MVHRLGALAPLLLVAVVLAACQAGSGGPSVAPSPSEGPIEWATFESERYGYTVDYPAGWKIVEQLGVSFVPGLRPFDAGTDYISTEDNHRYRTREGLQVASVEVEPSMTLDEFSNSVHMPCGGANTNEDVTFAGEAAIYREFGCNGNRPYYLQFTTLHEGRGYVLWFMSSFGTRADEREDFRVMIDSFAFTDAATAASGD